MGVAHRPDASEDLLVEGKAMGDVNNSSAVITQIFAPFKVAEVAATEVAVLVVTMGVDIVTDRSSSVGPPPASKIAV